MKTATVFGPTTRALLLIALMLITGLASPGSAQPSGMTDADRHFRVEWEPRQTKRGHFVAGYLYNSNGLSAERIRLRVQGLDAQANVVSTTLAWVGGVQQFSRAYFDVKVPGTAPASYRINVLSVYWACGGPGGGM